MTADHLIGIERFEADLWKVADNLRANSNLASNEYFMPILGLIFLRHATNRYYAAMSAIEEDKAAGTMPDRPLVEADFTRRRALMLPEPARYDVLLEMPKDGNLGAAVTAAMEAVEDHFPPLAGQLPKDYERFEDDVLEEMMRTFDSEALRTASGDVFGRIYEYFLAEFCKQGAHDNGEFFTPLSIVQTIVNVIEPDHGVVLDPACGSGGMFVQSSHFIEDAGEDAMKRVTFYGHEKNETTAKLAQINLAVHGLEGRIRAGNEAITYYKDPHELAGKCDFVMANPPFNVDEVDAEKVRGDKRLPFGLPGVNKAKKVSNANYLWLSYFYGYLNENGRAGVVMSSQASSAGRDEARVRQKLVESGAVDVMIDIRGNFFYTRTVPCQLWFFDRAKERDPERAGRVLMLDALDARDSDRWPNAEIGKARRSLESARGPAVEALRRTRHFVHQADWLQERFPDARLRDVEGLVKRVERGEVEAHDWSLTPGRYVGVAPEEEDEDFDFEEALRSIHLDLKGLNEEAEKLAARIARNFEELGV